MESSIIIERIDKLAKDKGVSRTKALIESGAGKDFVANIKKGQVPSMAKVQQISEYFDTSVDYIIGKNNKIKSGSELSLPLSTKRFYSKRVFNPKNRHVVVTDSDGNIIVKVDPEKLKASTLIDVNNIKVAQTYMELSEEDKLEVQLYILKKNKKPL